jgi:hypothetical protein
MNMIACEVTRAVLIQSIIGEELCSRKYVTPPYNLVAHEHIVQVRCRNILERDVTLADRIVSMMDDVDG